MWKRSKWSGICYLCWQQIIDKPTAGPRLPCCSQSQLEFPQIWHDVPVNEQQTQCNDKNLAKLRHSWDGFEKLARSTFWWLTSFIFGLCVNGNKFELTFENDAVEGLSSKWIPVAMLDWVFCDHWSNDMALWLWWSMTEFDISLSLSIEGSLACEDILFQKCFFSFFFSPAKQMLDFGYISNKKMMCPYHCTMSDFANRFLLNTENKTIPESPPTRNSFLLNQKHNLQLFPHDAPQFMSR